MAYAGQTKESLAAAQKAYRQAHPDRVKASVRKSRLKIKFGLTVEQFEEMLEQQGGVCAICNKECSTGKALSVDHDHSTGRIRGLLCWGCNTSIGKMEDNPATLRAAADYLERFQKESA